MIDCTNCIHFISDNNIYFECEYGLNKRQDFNTYKRCDLKVINDNEREETMLKSLEPRKNYKVKGTLLHDILELSALYNQPYFIVNGGHLEYGMTHEYMSDGKCQIVPFPAEKRDYLIGRIVKEIDNMEWEEI